MKAHDRLGEHGVAASSDDEPEAQTVSTYLATIRKHVLQDRALHDMVRPLPLVHPDTRLIPKM